MMKSGMASGIHLLLIRSLSISFSSSPAKYVLRYTFRRWRDRPSSNSEYLIDVFGVGMNLRPKPSRDWAPVGMELVVVKS